MTLYVNLEILALLIRCLAFLVTFWAMPKSNSFVSFEKETLILKMFSRYYF
jgi:hypothetical protein